MSPPPGYAIHPGVVTAGFQFASGEAVGRPARPSPFSSGTIELQQPHFKALGLDLDSAVPNLFRGTVNVALDRELVLHAPDLSLPLVDWTEGEAARIAPESFSFVRCCLAVDGRYHVGMIYYPHPETKPALNAHRYDVLEILSEWIDDLAPGRAVAVICRADAFRVR